MYHRILTKAGGGVSPFKAGHAVEPLRVSEGAVLMAFENQPSTVFAPRVAAAYGYILWAVDGVRLHEDDLKERIEFESPNEFQDWLITYIKEANEKDQT